MSLPEPLVGPQVNLQDFPFMPIDITRLFGSEFHASSDAETWRAGLTLWLKSWHQVPASSLPDEDTQLARLAELGREKGKWKRIREGALHGWVKCSDGRLYHRVVAEKALEGWIEKLAQSKSSGAGNAKRYGHEFDPARIDDELRLAFKQLAILNPHSRMLVRKSGRYMPKPPKPDEKQEETSPPDGSDCSPTGTPDDHEKAPKGQGQGQGQGQESSSLRSDGGGGRSPKDRFFDRYPIHAAEDGVERELQRRLAQGVDLDEIIAGAERYAVTVRGKPPDKIRNPVGWLKDGCWKDGTTKKVAAQTVVSNRTKVCRNDPEWETLSSRWKLERGRGRALNGDAWYFPNEWIADLNVDHRVSA